jgi:hypothetical protein
MTPSTGPGKANDPSLARIATVVSAFVLVNAGIFAAARRAASVVLTPVGLFISIGGGLLSAILIGSLGEWLVHRYFMHRRLQPYPLNLAYDLHHRGHHWIQYPPNEYLHDDRVQRVSISPHLARVCTTRAGRALTVALHVAFYSVFGVMLAVVPSYAFTGNGLFAVVVSLVTMIEIFLFVRVHDAVHHPGLSRLERFRWFQFLDRHHYIHHVDNKSNTNFLLPLCDLVMGVLRRELSPRELAAWPSYEHARRNVVRPAFDNQGLRLREQQKMAPTDQSTAPSTG